MLPPRDKEISILAKLTSLIFILAILSLLGLGLGEELLRIGSVGVIIIASQAMDPGSSPGRCKNFLFGCLKTSFS